MIKIYHKTATIKAERFDGSKEMAKRYGAELYSNSGYGYAVVEGEPDGDGYVLDTLKGELLVRIGDWIATGINGEHWPIADNIFQKTYVELPVIPKSWADTIEEYKANHYRLEKIFDTCIWNYDEQELIARAWLDGYQVEAQHDTRTD